MQVFISICIPAYKRIDFLRKLLDSIATQTFRDFEVIVTDDSPADEVRAFCDQYRDKFTLNYFKNPEPLGSPENWNAAIRKAKGKWIKLMHDDDWFESGESLNKFAMAASEEHSSFIFSGYTNVFIGSSRKETYIMSSRESRLLSEDPVNLLKKNFIGHPSTTLIRNGAGPWYDRQFKWVVDIEFYIRMLKSASSFYYIAEPLVNLGISSEQVTVTAFRNPVVEIPENIGLLKIISPVSLKKIWAYDYYWRFIRNLSVNTAVVDEHYKGEVPMLLQKMIGQQGKIPKKLMHIGVIAKVTMLFSYCWNRLKKRMR